MCLRGSASRSAKNFLKEVFLTFKNFSKVLDIYKQKIKILPQKFLRRGVWGEEAFFKKFLSPRKKGEKHENHLAWTGGTFV